MKNKLEEEIRNALDKNGCDIEFLSSETASIMAAIDKSTDSLVNEKTAEVLPEIKEKASIEALKRVRAEYRIAEGVKICGLSPFISEAVTDNGEELGRGHFILDKPFYDPLSEDIRLFFDDITERWLVKTKNGNGKLISRFVVTACIIVDASAPGSCRANVIFIKGSPKPLIFWGGTIEPAALRKQTQFHQKGLTVRNRDLYHESFLRALCMCHNVFFLTMPKHCGWNTTPNGERVFVSASNMISVLADLFYEEKE